MVFAVSAGGPAAVPKKDDSYELETVAGIWLDGVWLHFLHPQWTPG